jgi:hypothetical protein
MIRWFDYRVANTVVSGHLWFIRRYGLWRYVRYERERRRRIRETGVRFNPLKHGEALLRDIGASEEQITRCKAKGLA